MDDVLGQCLWSNSNIKVDNKCLVIMPWIKVGLNFSGK